VRGKGEITRQIADLALNMLDVDERGFDHQDRRLLLTLIEKFDGGPVGIDSLAAAISEERHTIEDVLEPYLIQQGYIMRTPRGRVESDTPCLPALRPQSAQTHERDADAGLVRRRHGLKKILFCYPIGIYRAEH